MTRKTQRPPARPAATLQYPARSSGNPLTGLLVAAGLLVLLVAVVSAPVATGVVLFGLLAAVFGYRRLRGHLKVAARETQSVTLPGIGTLRYRIRPR